MMELEDFTNTILPYKNKLYRYAIRMVGDAIEAEDIVQEVFIKLWKTRDKLHIYDNLEAWCITLTKNLAIDKLRSKHRRNGNIDEHFDLASHEAGPHQIAETQDTLKHIRTYIRSLPEMQGNVIQLRDIEGMSYQEIAKTMDISLDQVKVNLFRARKQIRQQLLNKESYGLK